MEGFYDDFPLVDSVKKWQTNQSKFMQQKKVVKLPLVVWVAGETPREPTNSDRWQRELGHDKSKSWAEFGWFKRNK